MTTLNYTAFDFETIKTNLINILRDEAVFNDYNFAGANINTFLELVAGVGDLFNFYINAMADESFISSAILYQNINRLVELIGYNPGAYKAATVTPTLSADITFDADDDFFEIPKWQTFSVSTSSPTGEEIKYTNPSKIIYIGTAGLNVFSDDIYLIQGIQDTQLFTGTGGAFQKYELTEEKAIEEYIEVIIDGETWSFVNNLYRDVDNTSKVFTTRFNKNKRIEISFGDGVFGVKPPVDAVITVNFIKTLGEDGQISANEITGLDSEITITLENGTPTTTVIDFTITQTDPSDGGRLPLNEEEVREYGPRSFRTQDRAASTQDHEDLLVSQFNEFVSQVVTLNSDDFFGISGESPSTSGNFYNNIYLYILPVAGNNITGNLQQEILTFLEDFKMATINYVLKNIDYRNIDTNVFFKKLVDTIRTNSEINSDLDATIRDFFKRSNINIGEEIKYSELLSELHDVSGISSVTLSLSSDIDVGLKYENIELGLVQYPILNNIDITFGGTGV